MYGKRRVVVSSDGSEVPSSGLLVGPALGGALRVLLGGAEEERVGLSGTERFALADFFDDGTAGLTPADLFALGAAV